MRWLLATTMMLLLPLASAAPLVLDGENRVLGYYSNWQNPTNLEYATSLNGYRFLFDRRSGKIDSYVNYLQVSYVSDDCTGAMLLSDYMPPGYLMPLYGGFDNEHPAPLVYTPQVPVHIIAASTASLVNHIGECQMDNRGPANYYVALFNDPITTGMTSSIFPAPARVVSQMLFFDGFD